MKKRVALFMSLCLLLSVTACSGQTETSAPVSSVAETETVGQESSSEAADKTVCFTPGTYTVTATGHNCDFDVAVTFSEEEITDIQIGENYETGYLSSVPMEEVRTEILTCQTPNVDTVSGATISTMALILAVKEACTQAGVSPDDFPAAEQEAVVYEDTSAQVVVVGSGTAGLAAAVEAAEQGLQTILIEQLGVMGGSSVRTGYVMGGSTESQIQFGTDEEYSKEAFVQYFTSTNVSGTGGGDRSAIDMALYNEELARQIAENAGENLNWLGQMGLRTYPVKFMHYALSADGNVSRLGPYMIAALADAAAALKVDCRLNTRAEELILTDGAVAGVRVTAPDGSSYTIHADAVILATGGYHANQDMIAEYNGQYAGYRTDVCKGADGSGMNMAKAAGAELICMDQANYHSFALVWRGASRSMSSVITSGAIAVNAEGKRFVNEDTYYDKSCSDAITAQTNGVCYVLLNQEIIEKVCVPGDTNLANDLSMYQKADTVEELARILGIDAQNLVQTLENYTEAVKTGTDKEFGRSADYLTASFAEGPYYGVQAMPELHTVHGGVRTDDAAHALNADGEIIDGLFVAGECAASPTLGSNTNTVALAMGRIAAQTIAAELDQQ